MLLLMRLFWMLFLMLFKCCWTIEKKACCISLGCLIESIRVVDKWGDAESPVDEMVALRHFHCMEDLVEDASQMSAQFLHHQQPFIIQWWRSHSDDQFIYVLLDGRTKKINKFFSLCQHNSFEMRGSHWNNFSRCTSRQMSSLKASFTAAKLEAWIGIKSARKCRWKLGCWFA